MAMLDVITLARDGLWQFFLVQYKLKHTRLQLFISLQLLEVSLAHSLPVHFLAS